MCYSATQEVSFICPAVCLTEAGLASVPVPQKPQRRILSRHIDALARTGPIPRPPLDAPKAQMFQVEAKKQL